MSDTEKLKIACDKKKEFCFMEHELVTQWLQKSQDDYISATVLYFFSKENL